MHNLFKQSLRRWLLSAGLALLLCLSIGFSVIGMTAWRVSERQASALEESYVTIAVAKEQSGDRWGIAGDGSRIEIEQITPDGSVEWSDGMWTFSPERIANTVAGAPGLKMVDHRCMLGAHVAGKRALASGTLDELEYNELYDRYRTNMCVLAVECTDVTVHPNDGISIEQQLFSAKMKILERISLLEDYQRQDQPEELVIDFSRFSDGEGNVPFEEGKTYLVLGFYEDVPIVEGINEELTAERGRFVLEKRRGTDWTATYGDEYFPYFRFGINAGDSSKRSTSYYVTLRTDNSDWNAPGIHPGDPIPVFGLDRLVTEDRVETQVPQEGAFSFYAEYQGSVEDFLNSEEGRVWKEEIIPMCRRNHESATVILTDNTQSIYAFNTGDASILEGRDLNYQDYLGGSNSCLVSAAYAQYHGMKVGDTLTLDLYDPGYTAGDGRFRTAREDVGLTAFTPFPLVEQTRLGVCKDYQIVGIYSGSKFASGTLNIQPNTIFIPKSSVPDPQRFEDHGTEMDSYILENGAVEKFEAYMQEQGMGDVFVYFDQNYEQAAQALNALRQNALRMLLISVAIFVLVAAVVLYLQIRRMSPVARGMRLLGVSRRRVWAEMTGVMAFWTVLATAAGTAAGMGLYHSVTLRILSEHLVMDQTVVALTAAAELTVLVLAEVIAAAVVSGRNLMQARKGT